MTWNLGFKKTESERSELLSSALQVDINNRYQIDYNLVQLVAVVLVIKGQHNSGLI